MNRLIGWLLLLVFFADSFVHPMLVSYEYVEVQRQLTALETELSAEKSEQIGQSQAIIVLDEQNARHRGDIYSDNFFAENRNGQTICYSIVDSSQLIDYQAIEKKSSQDPFSKNSTNAFFKLQKDLFCEIVKELSPSPAVNEEQYSFLLYLDTKADPFLTVQKPPPIGIWCRY